MAFGAATSLMNTVHRLLYHSRISIVSPSREILLSAYKDVQSLQKALKRADKNINSSTKRMKALERQMIEVVCTFEDVLESCVSHQCFAGADGSCVEMEEARQESNFLAKVVTTAFDYILNRDQAAVSQPESHEEESDVLLFSVDLQNIKQDIHCFIQTVQKMQEEYINELNNPLAKKDDDDDPSRSDFGGKTSEMIGLSDQFCEIRYNLLRIVLYWAHTSIVGMAGIGKTTLAKKILEDPLISKKFKRRFFITLGPKFHPKEILKAILAQVDPDSDKVLREDENLSESFVKILNDEAYLIVLDDLWSADFWIDIERRLPDIYYGYCRILVTTRLEHVARRISGPMTYNMRFLNEKESWDLLRENVFGNEVCPPRLEKAGKKIAENCEGLPLLIITVASLLSSAERTPEYWNKIATNKENHIFVGAYDQISKVLYPSYRYLPQHLKACFLYMAVFPQNLEIRRSRLINLWNAEGFLEPESVEDFAMECYRELVSNNVVVVKRRDHFDYKFKACSLHSVFWYLCKKEAGKNKFLHTLNRYADGLVESIESQRRLSIYKNTLLGIKDVYHLVASVSNARSLLCTGPYHKYQVPICCCLKFLRVLDAFTIRFYEFPVEVLKLVQLRYLTLTCNRNIPASISELWNLQYLIVYQHSSIKSTVAQSYLPVEIWDLQELKYLQITGRNLPDPPRGVVLWELQTLLDVGAHSCTRSVLGSIPNLKKLRVQIESAPDSLESTLNYFDPVSLLCKLKSFQCIVVNPKLMSKVVPPPHPLLIIPFHLKKLTLSGFGYPWEDLNKIATLPSLYLLKLQCYAFRGNEWEVKERGLFAKLVTLVIEDTDLVLWTIGDEAFPTLNHLTLKNCYKIQEIPMISTLFQLELVDCNPSAVKRAQQVYHCHTYIKSSWDDRNFK